MNVYGPDTAPSWLTAQLAPRKVMASLIQASISQLLKLCINCDDQSCLHIFLRSSNIWSFMNSFVISYCFQVDWFKI